MDINGNIVDELDKVDSRVTIQQTNENGDTGECGINPSISFPLLQRPSGLLPRQNSGINAILDTDLVQDSAKKDGSSTILENPGSGQIRASYEKPSVASRVHSNRHQPPLRLSNILHHSIGQGTSGGRTPSVLSRAFFESVREQVRAIKSTASAKESEEFNFPRHLPPPKPKFSESCTRSNSTIRDLHKTSKITLQSSISTSDPNPTTDNSKYANETRMTGKDSTNFNFNFTVKLSQFDGKSITGFDLKAPSQSRISLIEAKASTSANKVKSGIQAELAATGHLNSKDNINQELCDLSDPSHVNGGAQASLDTDSQENGIEGDWEATPNSVLSAELISSDPHNKRQLSTTDIIFNAVLSAIGINSSSTMVENVSSSIKALGKSSPQEISPVFRCQKEPRSMLSLSTLEPESLPRLTKKENTVREIGHDINGNVTESESDENDVNKKDLSHPDVLSAIGKVLEISGDGIMTALSLIANIIPMDETELGEEEMNACEGDLPIKVMRICGVPKNTRHTIYNEACGEVEVLQDLGTGTYDALTTVLKWICGGQQGREDFMSVVRTLSSVHTEVDFDSDVWVRVSKEVLSIKEAVDDAIQDDLNKTEESSDTTFDVEESALSINAEQAKASIVEQRDQTIVNVDECNDIQKSTSQSFVPTAIEEICPKILNMHTIDKNDKSYLYSNTSQYKINPNIFRQQLDNTGSSLGISENQGINTIGDEARLQSSEIYSVSREEGDIQCNIADFLSKEENLGQNGPQENNNNGWSSKNSGADDQFTHQNLQSFFSNRVLDSKSLKNTNESPIFINPVIDGQIKLNSSISSSVDALSTFPRAPPNSEAIFDRTKHEDKVIKDMTEISKLVQELYEGLNTPQQGNKKPKSKIDVLPSRIPIPSKPVRMNRSHTVINPKSAQLPQIHNASARSLSRNFEKTASVSTVSLYHSSRATDSKGSIMQSSPLFYNQNYEKNKYQNKEEGEQIYSCTTIYSMDGDSDQLSIAPTVGSVSPNHSNNCSFLKPTISTANKVKLKLSQRVSTSTAASTSSSTRISTMSNTSINENLLSQKLSSSSMESNGSFHALQANDNSTQKREFVNDFKTQDPNVQMSSYQQMYQKKNVAIAKQCMKSLGFGHKLGASSTSKPRFVRF